MRPGLNLTRAGLVTLQDLQPEGCWDYQIKLDEERAFLAEGRLYNRHGEPLSAAKAKMFDPIRIVAKKAFPNAWVVDLGLIGYRSDKLGHRGAAVVYDVVLGLNDALTWRDRSTRFFSFPILSEDPRDNLPGNLYRLGHSIDGLALYDAVCRRPGVEGVVGRRVDSRYQQEDSKAMLKARYDRHQTQTPKA